MRAFVHLGGPRSSALPVGDLLAGVEVAVKDLYRVEGMPTRAGSALPAELFEGPESEAVVRLVEAGATVIGKTAMDEFAYCEPPPTKNPLDLARTPGGSSGGSAAAVAAGFCPLALGSQTLQSTIVPAAYCGVLGYKATVGAIAFDGVALSPSIDTVGVLAVDFDYLKRAVDVLLDVPSAQPSAGSPVLGVPAPWGLRRLHGDGWAAFDGHVDRLRAAGCETVACTLPWNDDLSRWSALVGDLVNGEMAQVHDHWFSSYEAAYRPRTADAIRRGQAVTVQRLATCRREATALRALLVDIAAGAGIDAWVCPSTGTVAPVGYDSTGDSWMTCFWSYAGLPAISVPVPDVASGLPRGLQVIGLPGSDRALLSWARSLAAAITPA